MSESDADASVAYFQLIILTVLINGRMSEKNFSEFWRQYSSILLATYIFSKLSSLLKYVERELHILQFMLAGTAVVEIENLLHA